jgi:hypothetical protein
MIHIVPMDHERIIAELIGLRDKSSLSSMPSSGIIRRGK